MFKNHWSRHTTTTPSTIIGVYFKGLKCFLRRCLEGFECLASRSCADEDLNSGQSARKTVIISVGCSQLYIQKMPTMWSFWKGFKARLFLPPFGEIFPCSHVDIYVLIGLKPPPFEKNRHTMEYLLNCNVSCNFWLVDPWAWHDTCHGDGWSASWGLNTRLAGIQSSTIMVGVFCFVQTYKRPYIVRSVLYCT